MKDNYYYSQLSQIIETWLDPFQAAALLSVDQTPLYIKYQTLPDIGTLPVVSQTVGNYFKMNSSDIILTNDPYSGGSTLTAMNLITAFQFSSTKRNSTPDAYLCVRVSLKPHLQLVDSIENEGVRIPPTPIRMEGKLNEDLLSVISQHPNCPNDFINSITNTIKVIDQIIKNIQLDSKNLKLDWSKSTIKNYLKSVNESFCKKLDHFRTGETTHEMTLESGEKLKLNFSHLDNKIRFDFSGSGPSAHLHLTDSATFGACVGSMISVLDLKIPICAGVFECFEVRAPQGSLVNSKYPAPVYQGMTDGAGLIANFILESIGSIDPKFEFAKSGPSHCSYDLEFSNKLHFFDTLEPGMPAHRNGKGADATHPWNKSHLEPSVEEIEKRYPIQLQSCSIRQKSGGSGSHQGGNGVTKSILCKSDATLRWIITQSLHKPEGQKGGKSASSSEIYIQRKDLKDREKMPPRGEFNLKSGDTIIVHSSGGGGFGDT